MAAFGRKQSLARFPLPRLVLTDSGRRESVNAPLTQRRCITIARGHVPSQFLLQIAEGTQDGYRKIEQLALS